MQIVRLWITALKFIPSSDVSVNTFIRKREFGANFSPRIDPPYEARFVLHREGAICLRVKHIGNSVVWNLDLEMGGILLFSMKSVPEECLAKVEVYRLII